MHLDVNNFLVVIESLFWFTLTKLNELIHISELGRFQNIILKHKKPLQICAHTYIHIKYSNAYLLHLIWCLVSKCFPIHSIHWRNYWNQKNFIIEKQYITCIVILDWLPNFFLMYIKKNGIFLISIFISSTKHQSILILL